MPEMTDEQLEEELRKALAAEAMSIEVTDPAGRVARVRARQARDRSRRLWALAGIAAALIVALVAGIGYVAWSSRPETLPGATTLATPSATATAGPSSTAAVTPAPTGTFVPTGSMSTSREGHTATLLPDGRVLIEGGEGTAGPPLAIVSYASAELYDPKTGTFSPTGSMVAAPGTGQTATLLSDGRVLVAGGGLLASAELYDPKTGTFSPTGSMSVARTVHTATLLSDGRVLIAGGFNNGNLLASAEIYDPTTGTFSPTGSMTTARGGQTATLLPDGRVLITGGATNGDTSVAVSSAELYDPKTGTFSPTGSMSVARYGHTAVLLSNGRVLVVGGFNDAGQGIASAELYDPETGKFTRTGSMLTGVIGNTVTLLSDGRVLIAGGGVNECLADAELYDPETGKFSPAGYMTTARCDHTATLLPDGRVLIVGGGQASAELYDPKTGTFSRTGSMVGVVGETSTGMPFPTGGSLSP
jgi:hypothetical protein